MNQIERKYAYFSKDEDLQRWLRNLARGSPLTAEVAERRLGKVCELLSTTPQQMIESATKNLKQFQDTLEDLVTRLEPTKSPGYILGLLKVVRSWLRYNNMTLTRTIKVRNPNATPTIENEQIPTQPELARILRTSPPRIKVAEALIAFADLRPESIGNHYGTDGLTVGDLPELKTDNKQVTFEKIPTMVVVRATLSKTKHKYFTFLSQEGCDILKEYLEERLRSGEKLAPESPLIGHDRPKATERKFVTTKLITHLIREAMRAAGVYKRPYVLRDYAETQFIIAESKGKISHPYLQFIAGHAGDIEAKYSTNKGKLPPDMIEGMRTQYKASEQFLTTISTLDQDTVVKASKLEALRTIAKNILNIDLQDATFTKTIGLKEDLTPEKEIEFYEEQIKKHREKEPLIEDPSRFKSKLVKESQLEKYLNQGWQMVQVINSKILIRKWIEAPRKEEKQKAPERRVRVKKDVGVKHSKEFKKALAGLSRLAEKETISVK